MVGEMRKLLIVTILPALAGCAGSIVDPAPLDPGVKANVFPEFKPQVPEAVALKETSSKMGALAQTYAAGRNTIMLQQLYFDIPMMALAAATVAEGIFGDSKAATLGLGLGSAGFAGGKSYFGPQAKVQAYTQAASSLSCASAVAFTMATVTENYLSDAERTYNDLGSNLLTAHAALVDHQLAVESGTSEKLNKDTTATLLSARDAADGAHTALFASITSLKDGPARLQSFATLTVKNATDKIVTGTQNVTTAIALINAGKPGAVGGAPATTSPAPSNKLLLSFNKQGVKVGSVADLIGQLQTETSSAQGYSRTIDDGWAAMTACAVQQS